MDKKTETDELSNKEIREIIEMIDRFREDKQRELEESQKYYRYDDSEPELITSFSQIRG